MCRTYKLHTCVSHEAVTPCAINLGNPICSTYCFAISDNNEYCTKSIICIHSIFIQSGYRRHKCHVLPPISYVCKATRLLLESLDTFKSFKSRSHHNIGCQCCDELVKFDVSHIISLVYIVEFIRLHSLTRIVDVNGTTSLVTLHPTSNRFHSNGQPRNVLCHIV